MAEPGRQSWILVRDGQREVSSRRPLHRAAHRRGRDARRGVADDASDSSGDARQSPGDITEWAHDDDNVFDRDRDRDPDRREVMGGSMQKKLIGFFAALMWAALATTAYAQNAQITGAVKDSSGAIIPGATVPAKNGETGLTRPDVTNGQGEYRLSALPPGRDAASTELNG